MEWKRDGDDNGGGGGEITELLTAPPTRYHLILDVVKPHSPDKEGVDTIETTMRRAGRVHPNGHTSRGDGARGHRVSPPGTFIMCPSAAIFM
jgi:hypothetical protein